MNIIVPERKILMPGPGVSFKGEYRLRKLDAKGRVIYEGDWFENLVTNTGLDTIGAASAFFGSYCRIGTGNTAPSYADNQLVAQSASTNSTAGNTTTNVGTPNYETQTTITYQFPLGAVVGNMAEIGVGTAASGATLCSRALIVDGGGSPTTITVLVTEILQVVYRFTGYPNLTDATGTVTIGGVAYNYVSRTYNAAAAMSCLPSGLFFGTVYSAAAYPSTSTLGSIISTGPTGATANFTTSTMAAYTPGNYYRDCTLAAAIGDGNAAGGIATIRFAFGGGGDVFRNQVSFAAVSGGGPIPKDNTKALSIVVRQPFSHH